MSRSRAGFVEADPGVPGAGASTRRLDGPVSMRDRVPGRAGHAPPARVFAPAVLAGRAGKVPAAGQLASHTVSVPRAFRDRLAKASGERGARPWRGAACTTKRSRWRRAL